MKKILIIAMIVSLLLCPLYPASAQEAPAANDLTFAKTLQMIDQSAEGDAGVTRGELAKILFRIVMPSFDPASGGSFGECRFKDVTQDLAAQTTVLDALKIMTGTGETTFEPGRMVTYSELSKVMVSMLGYDVRAQDFGGYPSGYLRMVTQLSIGDDRISSPDAQVTYNTVATMLKRAVNVAVLEVKRLSPDEKWYTNERNASYLEIYLGISHTTAVMNADNLVDTTGKEEALENCFRVRVGDTLMKTSNDNIYIRDLIGYQVEAYYLNDDATIPEIVYCEASATNEARKIQDEDLIGLEGNSLRYYNENEKEVTLRLSAKTVVLYNDSLCANWDETTLKPFNDQIEGWLDLIDNNNDGIYDFVLVNAYESYVAGETKDEIIALKYRAGKFLDLSEKTNGRDVDLLNILKEPIALEDIEDGDVLNVFFDQSGNIKKIIVSIDSFIGEISMVTRKEGSRDVYHMGEMVFEASEVLEQNPQLSQLQIGTMAKIFLNMNMRICDIEISEFDMSRYGYVYALAESGTFQKEYRIKIFSDAGTFEEYAIPEKITFNQETGVKADKVIETLGMVDGKVKRQLVIFKTNTDRTEIQELTNWTGNMDTTKDGFYMYPGFEGQANTLYYSTGAYTFDGQLLLGSATKVFCVPTEANRNEERLYTCETRSVIPDGTTNYEIEAYGRQANNPCAEVLVVNNSESFKQSVSRSANVLVVQSVLQELVPETGATENVVEGFLGTSPVRYTFEDGALDLIDGKTVEPGDAIRVRVDKSNKILHAEWAFDYSDKEINGVSNPSTTYTGRPRYSYGTVEYYDGTSMKVSFESAGVVTEENFIAGSFNYLTCEDRGNGPQLRVSSTAELRAAGDYGRENASRVFLYQREGYSIQAIIFND